MFSAEFDSWFSSWFNKTVCTVKTGSDITYFFVFNAEHGVIGNVKTGEWQ